jgi:MSHA pilin protein MshD
MSIASRRRQSGLSLVELVMFIVIVGVAVAGVLSVLTVTAHHSADPMIRKQTQAIAEAMLEEIELQPVTYCDPDDANAATAASAAGCATTAEAMGPEAGETRHTSPLFDNVNDYHGYSASPIVDITNSPVAGLGSYTVSVTITQAGAAFAMPADDVLQIDVQAISGNTDITLTGYRFRYAPNAVP